MKAGRGCTILLVEDNPGDATLIREALLEHDVRCELVHVTDGQSALKFVTDYQPGQIGSVGLSVGLVILDVNLPRKAGSIVLEAIRSSAMKDVPVVMLTSSDDQRDRDDAARLGASAYIRKPSRLDELLRLGAIFKQMVGQSD